mmetsp:Transcript_17217/g.48458  ORF Transcript_17217/g.48458 Transcript_17217/m.48458 type:complete len:220 (+) Transcript_17217:3-662(+)
MARRLPPQKDSGLGSGCGAVNFLNSDPAMRKPRPIVAGSGEVSVSGEPFLGGYTIAHEDFDLKSTEYSIFRFADYSWKEHAFVFIQSFYEGAAEVLEEEFTYTKSLTYNTFYDSENICTVPFRGAIWHYVHRIQGVFHDDYEYREVNEYLGRDLKEFVKDVVCRPETISPARWLQYWALSGLNFRPEEKCHICLLAVESRKQAILLFGISALMEFETSR